MHIGQCRTAVILAAGIGNRLQKSIDYPKSLIRIQNESLIRRIIKSLIDKEFTKIVVVVGYKKELIFHEVSDYKDLIFITNHMFSQNGSMFSLSMGFDEIDDCGVVIEGDLFFDEFTLDSIIFNQQDSILCTPFSKSGDEMVPVFTEGRLINFSKEKKFIKVVQQFPEYMGISHFSKNLVNLMTEVNKRNNLLLSYEKCLAEAVSDNDQILNFIYNPKIIWSDFDFLDDLKRFKLFNKLDIKY